MRRTRLKGTVSRSKARKGMASKTRSQPRSGSASSTKIVSKSWASRKAAIAREG
jgi:hypothetical protein